MIGYHIKGYSMLQYATIQYIKHNMLSHKKKCRVFNRSYSLLYGNIMYHHTFGAVAASRSTKILMSTIQKVTACVVHRQTIPLMVLRIPLRMLPIMITQMMLMISSLVILPILSTCIVQYVAMLDQIISYYTILHYAVLYIMNISNHDGE